MTLDELIGRLQWLREQYGGTLRVVNEDWVGLDYADLDEDLETNEQVIAISLMEE